MIHRHNKKFFDWGRPKRRLENWGKRKIIDRKTKNLFSGVGVAAVTALFVIGIFAGIVITTRFLRQAIETKISQNLVLNIQRQTKQQAGSTVQTTLNQRPIVAVSSSATSVTETPPPPPSPPPLNLVYTSFTDLFSGNGWLDSGSTTMYRDDNETAFMFPPKYTWTQLSTSDVNMFDVGRQALEPAGVTTKIVQGGGKYKVLVYAPDGSEILSETSTPIVSNYPGQVGIGGTQNDFVVVYGAYWGAGARITSVNNSWQVQDLSQFFGIRPMNNGFQPEITYIDKSYQTNQSYRTYYIWSSTPNNPKLVKLFTNGTGQIQGAVDFSGILFTRGERSAIFGRSTPLSTPLSTSDVNRLVAKVTDASSNISYYQFADEGFDKSRPRQIVSANLSNYPGTLYSATITNLDLSLGGGTASFFFSNDGANWIPATQGREVNFPNALQPLYWKAIFAPLGLSAQADDQWNSPWFGTIGISYQVKY